MSATIAICVPTRGAGTPSAFTAALANLVMHSTETLVHPGHAALGLIFSANTYVDKGRDELVAEAMKSGVSHVLFLDDDMSFPRDALIQLLRHDADIVGANYPTRKLPIVPTAIKTVEDPPTKCFSDPQHATGLEPVEALGFGCVLIKAPVFAALYPRPWFEQHFDRVHDRWVGEDVQFCQRARAAGFDVLVDHDLSRQVIHHGLFEFHNAHTMLQQETADVADDVHGAQGDDRHLVEPERSHQ